MKLSKTNVEKSYAQVIKDGRNDAGINRGKSGSMRFQENYEGFPE